MAILADELGARPGQVVAGRRRRLLEGVYPQPGSSAGGDGVAYFFNDLLRPAFPDLFLTIYDQVVESDEVGTRMSYAATRQARSAGVLNQLNSD